MMMKRTLYILLFLCASAVMGQSQLDSVVSITFLETPEFLEDRSANAYVKGFYENNETDSFVFVRTLPLDGKGNEIITPSKNIEDVRANHDYAANALIKKMKDKMFYFSDSARTTISGFEALTLTFKDPQDHSIMAESLLLELNGIQYMGLYSMVTEFNEERKNAFFESLTIKNPQYQKQVQYVAASNWKELWIGSIVAIALIALYLTKYYRSRKKVL